MADKNQLEILKKGVEEWNTWREENEDIKINLSGVSLGEIPLSKRSKRELNRADLSGINLSGADLSGAQFRKTLLNSADLRKADLRKAHLGGTYLIGTDLSEANLTDAIFFPASISSTNLKEAKGLITMQHWGPIPIDKSLFETNEYQLPEEFLINSGLKKWEIKAFELGNPKLSPKKITDLYYEIDELRNASPIQMHNLFISYSHQDNEFIEHLEKTFKKKNISYWRDIHDAPAGPLEGILVRAIHQNPTVLLVFSKESIESEWCLYEIEKARELEKKLKRPVLCPIALDDSWKEANWPERLMKRIMDYHVLDFSNWQNEDFFDQQYQKLLKGLNIFYRNDQ